MFLHTHAPRKRIDKYKMKFKSKPSITSGLQKSITAKNKLLKKIIHKKDPTPKEELHINYKNIEIYYTPLRRKVNRLITKNVLKEIGIILIAHGKELKSLISLKTVASNVPTVLSLDNGDSITNPYITNMFNNYFAPIAETTKKA